MIKKINKSVVSFLLENPSLPRLLRENHRDAEVHGYLVRIGGAGRAGRLEP